MTRVWLLWEENPYEAPELHGVYQSRDGATRAGERLRRKWRHTNVSVQGVGQEGTFDTRQEAHEAADRRAADHLYVTDHKVRP